MGRLITIAITIKLEAFFIFLIFVWNIFGLLFNFYLRLHNDLYFDLIVFCLILHSLLWCPLLWLFLFVVCFVSCLHIMRVEQVVRLCCFSMLAYIPCDGRDGVIHFHWLGAGFRCVTLHELWGDLFLKLFFPSRCEIYFLRFGVMAWCDGLWKVRAIHSGGGPR